MDFHTRIRAKLAEIATCLAFEEEDVYPYLFKGTSGEILFLMYYSRFTNEEYWYNCALERIEQNLELINRGDFTDSFSKGIAGLFWGIEHLIEQEFIEDDFRESLVEFDHYLGQKMLAELSQGNFDFLDGALGITCYLLKRYPDYPNLSVYLEQLIPGLRHCAKTGEKDTLMWCTRYNSITTPNIGLSHGMSSIMILLSKLVRANITPEQAISLLNGAVNYILSQEIDPTQHGSCFPSMSIDAKFQKQLGSRMAWCYGDLGVGVGLLEAAQVTGNQAWQEKAMAVLKHSCSRSDPATNHVHDAGLCHGSAGVAHIFRRLYLNTSNPDFSKAAAFWYGQTLNFASNPKGIAGFMPNSGPGKVTDIEGQRSFLIGVAGIGLSLIHAVSDELPAWDECLLLS